MDTFAQQVDVVAVFRPLTPAEVALVPGLLAEASTKLRAWGLERNVDVDQLIADDPLRESIAKIAVANAVKRALQVGTDGAVETTVAQDDFRETVKFDAQTIRNSVSIDIADLRGLVKGRRSRWGTIRLGTAL